MKLKTAVLLVQLGTPDAPTILKVYKYLTEFLNDARVIDIPWLLRKILVNVIIIPFRVRNSTRVYKELWTENGSPLLLYTDSLRKKLQNALINKVDVFLAMRYQNPSMEKVLEEMRLNHYDRILILPLFPQYASATSASVIEKAMKIISRWYVIPEVKFVSHFFDNSDYINCFVENGKKFAINEFDHVLFSYHGLPERQVDKVYDDGKPCSDHNCEMEINDDNRFCYKAQCYATTRLIVRGLSIPEDKYTVCFQSRLDKKWLEPFADKTVVEQAKKGAKKLLVFSPAFVADCLETTIEIGVEYQEIFEEHGGEKVQLVDSLNDSDLWVAALKKLIEEKVS